MWVKNEISMYPLMLDYELKILEDTKSESFILVSGHGIHLNTLININILMYLNKYSFAFLLNFDELSLPFSHEYLRILKNCDKQARKKMYLKGGVFVCSSRILLTDFLENNINIEIISAIIINNADRIRENSLEAFILNVFRRKNAHGLIKAFSSNCIPFACGIGSLEKYANTFRCNNFILYPRFHEEIQKSFKNDIKFLQHEFKMPDEMIELQMILIEILKELIKYYKLDVDYELVLLSNTYLSKQVFDILDIKFLLILLYSCNLSKFYTECIKLISKQIECGKESTWLNSNYTKILIDKIDLFFAENEQFVSFEQKEVLKNLKYFFKHKKIKKQEEHKCEFDSVINNQNITFDTQDLDFLEELKKPLFNLKFRRLIRELILLENESCFVVFSSMTVLNDVENIVNLFNSNLLKNVKLLTKKQFVNSNLLFSDDDLNSRFIKMNKNLNLSKSIDEFYTFYIDNNSEEEDVSDFKVNNDIIFIDVAKSYNFFLYDKDLASIRKCEYIGTKANIVVHSFQFRDSLEEQNNLLSLRKEISYFEQLIQKRGNLPILSDINRNILEDEISDEDDCTYDIVVDSRELRAELPFFLYKAGNNIIIATLQIGDYLINENICIERKSIGDFISSMNAGRLYSQIRILTYHYTKAILLLEFSSRPCLSDFYNHNADTFRNSLISKFCFFLITFPSIKVLWSDSTFFTTKIFRKMQKKNLEDDVVKMNVEINPILQEILLSIPGVNQFNLRKVVKHYKNLKQLVTSNRITLQRNLGQDTGFKIYKFFNDNFEE